MWSCEFFSYIMIVGLAPGMKPQIHTEHLNRTFLVFKLGATLLDHPAAEDQGLLPGHGRLPPHLELQARGSVA
jgi:hypothetical protein